MEIDEWYCWPPFFQCLLGLDSRSLLFEWRIDSRKVENQMLKVKGVESESPSWVMKFERDVRPPRSTGTNVHSPTSKKRDVMDDLWDSDWGSCFPVVGNDVTMATPEKCSQKPHRFVCRDHTSLCNTCSEHLPSIRGPRAIPCYGGRHETVMYIFGIVERCPGLTICNDTWHPSYSCWNPPIYLRNKNTLLI